MTRSELNTYVIYSYLNKSESNTIHEIKKKNGDQALFGCICSCELVNHLI